MRVLVFLLMAAVAVGGTLYGYRLITGKDLVSLAELGLPGVGSAPTRQLTVTVTPTRPLPSPTATPTPTRPPATATAVPDAPQLMLVGNTDGQGVYIRRTPNLDDRVRAWQEGAKMEIIGSPVEANGRKWYKVRAPDGMEGYIPAEYLVNAS